MEACNSVAAEEAGRPLTSTPIGHRERMSYLGVDVGRAFSQLDRFPELCVTIDEGGWPVIRLGGVSVRTGARLVAALGWRPIPPAAQRLGLRT